MSSTTIDLNDPAFAIDPYPFYQQLRETEPAYQTSSTGPSGGMWLITRYADVAALFREAHYSPDLTRIIPIEQLPPMSNALPFRDPPDHTRLRSLVGQAFTPRRVHDLEPRIAAIADELLARVRPRGGMDFVADFAAALPSTVIAEMMGVPSEDRAQFQAWSEAIARGSDYQRASEEEVQAQNEAGMAFIGYFGYLFEQRRRQPQDDLLSALLAARDVQGRLSESELLETCSLLLLAGYETTVRLLGNGLFTLLRHPDQFDTLRRNPDMLPLAIEEMLRYESPVQQPILRVATESVEIGGRRIEAGQILSAVIGSANRDPDQFPNPDRFDIAREPNRHLAFGFGVHFCLGAPLARLEGRIAFTRLFEQMPNLRLVNDQADWVPNTRVRGLRSLPVTF